ncbi:hypothetical protein [Paucilactobacillus sp. N302-9]
MTTKDKLIVAKKQLQVKLAVWLITTVSFYVIQYFFTTAILKYIAWLCSAYCLILFCLLLRLQWLIVKSHDE